MIQLIETANRNGESKRRYDYAPHDFRSALNAALVAMALRDSDPVERAAKLAILKKDGWL